MIGVGVEESSDRSTMIEIGPTATSHVRAELLQYSGTPNLRMMFFGIIIGPKESSRNIDQKRRVLRNLTYWDCQIRRRTLQVREKRVYSSSYPKFASPLR
jgi:hypothetical protein